jgi:preprotein translocase subunit YajC
MGFNRGDKVIDVSGAIGKVIFVDPDRKKVAIVITEESETMSAMREGREYSVPERQLQKWSSGAEEKIKKKRGLFGRKRK